MSITIIEGGKPFSAKYIYKPPPDFHLSKHPQLDAQRYYDAQKQIWVEGYYRDGVKILSGKHYFYMQEIRLKTGKGEIIRPHWKDSDQLVFDKIDWCMENKKDLFVLKRREIGLTSMIAGGLSFWFARIYPGSTLNMTSADRKRFVRMFEDKIYTSYKYMSPYIMNCTPKNINRTKNDVYLKIEIPRKLDDGTEDIAETEFNLAETSQSDDSVTNFSSSRTPLMFVDEIFLHPRVMKLIRSTDATRMSGTDKFGFFIGGGTCEESVTQEQLQEFHRLWIEGQKKGVETLFLPAWMGLDQLSVNGWSDEKAGTEWVQKTLEEKELLSDPNEAIAFRKNYPLSEDDVWDLAKGGGAFESVAMDTMEDRLRVLVTEGCKEAPVKPQYVNGEYSLAPDTRKRGRDDGGFWMVDPPIMGQKYYQSIDGAASGKEDGGEEGSWIASVIWTDIGLNGDNYCPVNIYFERPQRLEDGYKNMVDQFNFYNKYEGMIHCNYETNAGLGGNYGTYLDNNGLFKYIMRRKDLTSLGYINTKKLGTAVDEHIKANLRRRANLFLPRHVHKWHSKMILNNLLLPKDENADLRSSFLIFMASISDWDKPKKAKKEDRVRSRIILTKDANGQTKYKTEVIQVSNSEHHPAQMDSLTLFQLDMEKKYGAYWYQKATGEEKESYRSLKGSL